MAEHSSDKMVNFGKNIVDQMDIFSRYARIPSDNSCWRIGLARPSQTRDTLPARPLSQLENISIFL